MAEAARRRVLYYCQSLVGVGHLTSSLRIIDELLAHCDVDLIHGGLGTAPAPAKEGFRSLRLPTLLHDEDRGELFDPEPGRDIAQIWSERGRAIGEFLRGPYHAIVLEFYPFGRRRFKHEIGALVQAVHVVNGQQRQPPGPVPVFTSVREVLVPRALPNERRMVASVKKHIHTVFIRGDPQIVRFEETFSLAPEIAGQLCYTGYISPPLPRRRPARERQVLVSQGGGDVGRELLQAAIGAATLMPQYHFKLACGARTSAEDMGALRSSVRSVNVEIVPFLPDFLEQLMRSDVSISMGGDNTLLDVLSARTPALAYPYQGNPEQGFRIRKFADKGLVHELGAEDLVAERLKQRIERALATPYPACAVAVDGARTTSERIKAVLQAQPAAPAPGW